MGGCLHGLTCEQSTAEELYSAVRLRPPVGSEEIEPYLGRQLFNDEQLREFAAVVTGLKSRAVAMLQSSRPSGAATDTLP